MALSIGVTHPQEGRKVLNAIQGASVCDLVGSLTLFSVPLSLSLSLSLSLWALNFYTCGPEGGGES